MASMIRPGPMPQKQTPLERNTRKGIPTTSIARAFELGRYAVLKEIFLKEHPVCMVEGCFQLSSQIHHKNGQGKYLNDESTWLAVCFRCHEEIEGHKNAARAKGYITYK